jgi:hypothetical protein
MIRSCEAAEYPASVRILRSQNIEVYSEPDSGARTAEKPKIGVTLQRTRKIDGSRGRMTHRLVDYAVSGHIFNGAQADEIMEEVLNGS